MEKALRIPKTSVGLKAPLFLKARKKETTHKKKKRKERKEEKNKAEIIFTLTWFNDTRCRIGLYVLKGHEFESKLNFKLIGWYLGLHKLKRDVFISEQGGKITVLKSLYPLAILSGTHSRKQYS
jgi:hypothetical protein